MLIQVPARRILSEGAAALYVADWLAQRFIYERDPERTAEGLPPENWPTRQELEGMVSREGVIKDDCDGCAFGAVYAFADLGFKARVHRCWTEPVADEGDSLIRPRFHMVCETERGYVLDNRFLGYVLSWASREFAEYTRQDFSGFFEFGEVAQWQQDKEPIPPAGRR